VLILIIIRSKHLRSRIIWNREMHFVLKCRFASIVTCVALRVSQPWKIYLIYVNSGDQLTIPKWCTRIICRVQTGISRLNPFINSLIGLKWEETSFELVMIINNNLWTSAYDERYGPCISVFCRVNDKQKYCNQRRKFTAMVVVNIIQS